MKKILVIIIFFGLFSLTSAIEESLKGNQRASYKCSESIDIDHTKIKLKKNKIYFHFNKNESPKDIKSLNKFKLKDKVDKYFIGYLINTTDSTFSATRQDGSLIIIQEAIDKDGKWKPIEYWVFSGCGNSYFRPLVLKSGQYVIIPIKKYSGNYKTKIRLKFRYGKDLIYSEPFEGSINLSLFIKETKNVEGILYNGPASYLD